MGRSSSCLVELTTISAEDLRINGRPVKKKTFVTIETDCNCSQSTSWNEKLQLSLPQNVNQLRLYVKYKRSSSARTIGSVSIPVSDFLEDYVPPNCLHFLSYRLREHDGDRNGIVNLSIRVKEADFIPQTFSSTKVEAGCPCQPTTTSINSTTRGWIPLSRNHHQATYTSNNGGMAMGIPVSKGYMV